MKKVEIGGQNIEITSTIDAVGLFCPMPIVKLKMELEQVNSSQIVEVLADDPGFEEDIISWCKDTNTNLLSLNKNQEDIFTAYVEKHETD